MITTRDMNTTAAPAEAVEAGGIAPKIAARGRAPLLARPLAPSSPGFGRGDDSTPGPVPPSGLGVAVPLSSIEMDASIQCRADIDTATVNDYAERMQEGDVFPPIDVFGTAERCWIGDGWHRVLASLQFGFLDITACVHPGGRLEALRHALGANAMHGRRRTNPDKHRAVELALREFGDLSSRQIAELCGVSKTFVVNIRPEVATVATSTVTGRDGKEYRATRPQATPTEPRPPREGEMPIATEAPRELPRLGPPQNGMQFARLALMDLEQITKDDLEREQAFQAVRRWIDERS